MRAADTIDTQATIPLREKRPVLLNLAGFMLIPATTLALVLCIAMVGIIYFENSHQDRIYPGVAILGIDLGGMSAVEAKKALDAAFPYPDHATFSFTDPGTGKTWTATPSELGLDIDLDATVNEALGIGREGEFLDNLLTQLDVYRFGRQLAPVVVVDLNGALSFMEKVALEIYRPVTDASLVFAEDELFTTPSQIGRQMNLADAYNLLSQLLLSLQNGNIQLVVDETWPQITDEAAAEVLVKADKITRESLTVYLPEKVNDTDPEPQTLSRQELADMLILWLDESISPPRFMVRLDEAALTAWLAPLVDLLKTEPKDARFIFNDETGQLDVVENSVPARSLNVAATVERIIEQASTDNHRVPLVIDWTKPEVNEDATGAQLGITELIAVGESSFAGSSDVRVHNIATAASRFLGIVVKPGEEFSFNKYLGDVTEETGFEEGLIIFGGRTIKGVGGGVCQVSTTIFRAALRSGFPIPERWPHGYRVGYYEQGTGPGLDATVFYPAVDFRFVNDSPYYVLIEAYTYEKAKTLEFKFYSTKDGRTVEIGEPEVSNVIPHPPDRYEENPELATGEINKVDWAADGADVVIKRIVKAADGSVMLEDEFESHYLPWQAVYEYGPGTEGMPPPEAAAETEGATATPETTDTTGTTDGVEPDGTPTPEPSATPTP